MPPQAIDPTEVEAFALRRRRLAFLFAFAFAIRLAHILLIRTNPFFEHPWVDADFGVSWKHEFSRYGFLGEGVYYQAPLYPYFLALISKVWGFDFLLPRLLQAVIDAGSCILTYVLARRVGGDRVGWIAGIIAALYGPLIFFQGMLLETILSLFLIEAALVSLIGLSQGKSLLRWLGSGLLLGLACLARPNMLIVLPFLMGWGAWALRRADGYRAQNRLAIWLRISLLALGTVLPIIPVTWRNYRVASDVVLISSDAGHKFFIGNNRLNTTGSYYQFDNVRSYPRHEAEDFRKIAEESIGTLLEPSEISRYFFRRGLEFIRTHPGSYLVLQGKKLLLYLNHREAPGYQHMEVFRRFSLILQLPLPGFGLIAPLGLAGLVLLWRRHPGYRLLAIYTVAYSLSVMTFYVLGRYRIPIVPTLIVFAAGAIDALWLAVSDKKWGDCKRWAALIVPFAVVVWIPLPFMDWQLPQAHARLGRAYMIPRPRAEAIPAFEEAVRLDPENAAFHSGLGFACLWTGDLDRAEKAFLEVIRLRPRTASSHWKLGFLYDQMGRKQEAKKLYLDAIEIEPSFLDAHWSLAMMLDRMDETDEAIQIVTAAIKTNPPNVGELKWLRAWLVQRRQAPR
ncbi:MAG: tetratricopeptide repeat protein [Planctomycetota bacterium]|nr:tetratricopeptide repeat protein [Planctomycetota bacterium]